MSNVDISLSALPGNADTERLVLGCILADDTLLHAARPMISPDLFTQDANRRIWLATSDLYDNGQRADRATVAAKIANDGHIQDVGGLTYLLSLDEGLPRLPDITAYVQILRDHATRRRIIALGDNLIRRAANNDSPTAILEALGASALDLAPRDAGRGLVSAADLVGRVGVGQILAPRTERGVPFPWAWMTENTCGMLPGELWVLAAHTSVGKTSAAIQCAVHAAIRGVGASIHSLEMGDVSVFQRAVWQLSRVDSTRAKRGQLSKDERVAAQAAVAELAERPIYLDDGSRSVMEIHAAVRRQSLKAPIGLIVVDYLQLLEDGGRYDNRAQAVGANARRLKLMAQEFKAPVLLLSQFNRESAKPDKARRPSLTDLKESGDIENHSNGVWFIHRPGQPNGGDEVIPVEFILAKQRDGARDIFTSRVQFRPAIQSFEEVA